MNKKGAHWETGCGTSCGEPLWLGFLGPSLIGCNFQWRRWPTWAVTYCSNSPLHSFSLSDTLRRTSDAKTERSSEVTWDRSALPPQSEFALHMWSKLPTSCTSAATLTPLTSIKSKNDQFLRMWLLFFMLFIHLFLCFAACLHSEYFKFPGCWNVKRIFTV